MRASSSRTSPATSPPTRTRIRARGRFTISRSTRPCGWRPPVAISSSGRRSPPPRRPACTWSSAAWTPRPPLLDVTHVPPQGASSMEFATKTIHAGQPCEPETGSLIAPIFQTSTYEQESPGQDKGFNYSRTNNPTRQRLEAVLAELEGVQHAAVYASGLAAENAVLQAY